MREDPLLPETELRALFDAVVRQRGVLTGEHARPRELDVLFHRVARGLSNQEVAGVLVISVRTVQSYLDRAALRLRYDSPAIMRDELFRSFARAEVRAVKVPQ